MAATAGGRRPRSRLRTRSALVLAAFLALLGSVQLLLLRPWAVSRAERRPDEAERRLYQDALRGLALLYERELRAGREAAERLAATLLDDVVAERTEAVQRTLAEFRKEHPEAEQVFFFNRFGRLLAVEPFRREWRHEIYEHAPYFSWMRANIHPRRPSSTFYHPLLETPPPASLPPFAGPDRRPPAVFAAGCVGRRTFWGYAGYTVPLAALAERTLADAPKDLLTFQVLSAGGHVLHGPSPESEGRDAKQDPLLRPVLERTAAGERSGVLEVDGRQVFYRTEGGLVFVAMPSRPSTTAGSASGRLGGWVRWAVLFGVEVLLAVLLFGLYVRRVLDPLGELVRRHAPEDLPWESEDEFSLLGTMLERGEPGKGPIEDYLFRPGPEERGAERAEPGEVSLIGLRDGPATAVYVALRNLADLAKLDPAFVARFYRALRRLASACGGTVQWLSSDGLTVLFGVEAQDPDHAAKAGRFLTRLLALVRKLDTGRPPEARLRVACAAETGSFVQGRFAVGGREEPFAASPLLRLLRAYESLAGDNTAIVGDALFQAAPTVEDRFLRKRLRLKVREAGEEPVEVYLYRV